MKKNRVFLLLIVLLAFLRSEAQSDSLKVLYALDAHPDDSTVINRDTLFFEKGNRPDVFFINNRLYAKNKLVYYFEDATWFGEMLYVYSNKHTYVYIYPFYKNESGPYIWKGSNGVMIKLGDNVRVKKKIPFFDYGDLLANSKYKDYFK